jgi:hypothetical protein
LRWKVASTPTRKHCVDRAEALGALIVSARCANAEHLHTPTTALRLPRGLLKFFVRPRNGIARRDVAG